MSKKVEYVCLISVFMFLAFPSHGMAPQISQDFPLLDRNDSDPENPDEVDEKTQQKDAIKNNT